MLDLSKAEQLLTCLPIRDRFSRRLIPFKPKPGQHEIIAALKRQQDRKRPGRVITVKARRVGVSSVTDALGVLHGMANPAALGLIVAHQFKSSKGLFEVPLNLIKEHLPHRKSLQEMCHLYHTKHQIVIPRDSGDSTLDLATAGSVEAGRGLSFSFLHLSEAAFFPGIQSFLSLLPTVPFDPSTILVIESTANGRVGPGEAFYDFWMNSVEGQTDYEAVFLPWHQDPTCIRVGEEAPGYPANDYERELHDRYHCIEEQIAWWRATLETDCNGNMQKMQQEYPASAEEAFIATGDPAFEPEELEYVRSTCRDPEVVGDIHCPRQNLGVSTTAHFEPRGEGDWCIYHLPVAGHRYFIGADAARGMQVEEGEIGTSPEGDFAAVVVIDETTNEGVARLAKRISPEVLARKLNACGRFYNNAMVNIELTGNLGLWAQKVLRDPPYSYPNLYRWRGSRDDRVGDQNKFYKRNVIGWETTVRSREMLLESYRAALRQRIIIVYDRILLTQMENATRKEGFRWEVVRGHDDILMAAMLAWLTREQWGSPILGERLALGSRQTLENESQRGAQYKEGPPIIDGVAMTLATHFDRLQHLIKNKNKPNPLQGI